MREQIVHAGESALLIITGNLLKDPDTTSRTGNRTNSCTGVSGSAALDVCVNEPRRVPSTPEAIARIIEETLA